jgi:endonuclease V-like protein UPF0215 family
VVLSCMYSTEKRYMSKYMVSMVKIDGLQLTHEVSDD